MASGLQGEDGWAGGGGSWGWVGGVAQRAGSSLPWRGIGGNGRSPSSSVGGSGEREMVSGGGSRAGGR